MNRRVAELVRYGVKGGAATLANVGLMAVLVEVAAIPPSAAALLSTSILLIFGYIVMDRWVFADQDSPKTPREHLARVVRYYTVILSGKAVNYVLFVALVTAGVWYPLSWLLGAGVVFLGTFSANRYLWHGGVGA